MIKSDSILGFETIDPGFDIFPSYLLSTPQLLRHRRQHAYHGVRNYNSREIEFIENIVLHQTTFSSQYDLRRYDRVHAHFVVLRTGRVLQVQRINAHVESGRANRLSRRSIQIEFDGRFIADVDRGVRNGYSETPRVEQIKAGRDLVTYLKRRCPTIQNVLSHRQTTYNLQRDSCPGPHIWYNVGHWAVRNLNLGNNNGAAHRLAPSGRAIPPDWTRPEYELLPI